MEKPPSASLLLQLEQEKEILLLNRKCRVEPFHCCAPQTWHSSHSLKMHKRLYQQGLESSQGYTRASCYLFLPFLCLLTHQQPEHFSCELTRWSESSRCGRHQKLQLHINNKGPSLPDYLSRGAITVLPPLHLQHVTDCPTSFNTWAVSCFDPVPHPPSILSVLRSNQDVPDF